MIGSSPTDVGTAATGATARFSALYEELYAPLLAYCLRRVGERSDAADALAEVFTVAWRRIDEVPDGPQARLWLYGTAGRVLANHRRSRLRQAMLVDRLRREPDDQPGAATDGDHASTIEALHQLSAADQEVLRLSAWEDLTPTEIATVLGIRAVSARSRLLRARRRLAARLDHRPTSPEGQR